MTVTTIWNQKLLTKRPILQVTKSNLFEQFVSVQMRRIKKRFSTVWLEL